VLPLYYGRENGLPLWASIPDYASLP